MEGASEYKVQLYKGSKAVGNPASVNDTTHTFEITEAGTYHFTVKAVSDDVDGEAAESEKLTFYSATFNTSGGSTITSQIVANGGKVTEPAAPTKSGCTFAGWFEDESLTDPWDFNTDTVTGDTTLYAKWTENPKPATPSKPAADRISGDDRFETAVEVADQLKKELGVTKFNAIVVAYSDELVAYSDEFADALSASAFAQENEAPVLVVNENSEEYVKEYIEQNLVKGGKVYIMGGNAVVTERFENSLSEFNVSRLGGDDRYETNLTIIMASGLDYADALSASSTGLPVMIVGEKLTDSQSAYLKTLGGDDTYYIAGGTSAVISEVEKQLKDLNLGTINRLAGDDRYETSVLIAETFYSSTTLAYLASGDDFPDGLTGGVLAGLSRDGKGAPLLLVNEHNTSLAASYIEDAGVRTVKAIGGTAAITDETLKAVI